MKRFLLLLPFLCALPACTSWPEEGRGGWAERRLITDPRLDALAARFHHQRARGADRFAAGTSDEAKTLFVRAQRNHAAGFCDDLTVDLAALHSLLDTIERQIAGQ